MEHLGLKLSHKVAGQLGNIGIPTVSPGRKLCSGSCKQCVGSELERARGFFQLGSRMHSARCFTQDTENHQKLRANNVSCD